MTAAPIHLGSERIMLDPAGVAMVASTRAMVVADLHFEKGSHFAAGGRFVPPYDTRDTLARLGPLIRRYGPRRLILLGDSFHDARGATRLQPADLAALLEMLAGIEVVWVLGNHDPVAPAGLPGLAAEEWREGGLVLRHQGGGTGAEVSGHFHPKASLPTRMGLVTRACFLADGRRLLMPAFGSYCGGLAVTDPAIAALFPRGGRAFLLGKERLHSYATGPLRGAARAQGEPAGLTRMGGGDAPRR
jgi:DNA ligase-associated metallophosphoesterase